MNAWIKSIVLVYVNIFFIISMSACQTVRDRAETSDKQTEILNSQKALIVSLLNQGQAQMAHGELRSLIHQYPNDADFKNLMGLTLLALDNPRRAVQFFQQSLQIERRASVALNLSSAYIEAEEYDRAIKLLLAMSQSEALKSYRFPERITHNIALAAERKKDWPMAERYYQKALSENPQYYLSLMRLGQLYEKTERPQLAVQRFLTARAACNQCFDPVNGLVMNYLAMRTPERALETLNVYLRQKEIAKSDRERARKLLQMTENVASNLPANSQARPAPSQQMQARPQSGQRQDMSTQPRNRTSQRPL